MLRNAILLVAGALCTHLCVAASCAPETLEALAKVIVYRPAAGDRMTCKLMPSKPQYTIVALAQFRTDPAVQEEFSVGDYDLELRLVDTASFVTLKKWRRDRAIAADAVALVDLAIDTGKYPLNDRQRAFGLRITLANNSRLNPYSQTLLNLYLENDNALEEIVQNLEVASHSGEWDGNCAGEFTSAQARLFSKKPQASGFSDLSVKTETQITVAKLRGDVCSEKRQPKKIQYSLLRYADGSYQPISAKPL